MSDETVEAKPAVDNEEDKCGSSACDGGHDTTQVTVRQAPGRESPEHLQRKEGKDEDEQSPKADGDGVSEGNGGQERESQNQQGEEGQSSSSKPPKDLEGDEPSSASVSKLERADTIERQSMVSSDYLKYMSNPKNIERRFPVDRKRLERMIIAGGKNGESAEDYFKRVMEESSTLILWPSRLKIGAKSKKDPQVKVVGRPEGVQCARDILLSDLDSKSTRVTLKLDIQHSEHTHVIGKEGCNIKRVQEETNCHIHFPDSNRSSRGGVAGGGASGEKSNQVSITGHVRGVEMARVKIKEFLPLALTFSLALPGPVDPAAMDLEYLMSTYNCSITIKPSRGYTVLVVVRSSVRFASGLTVVVAKVVEYFTGDYHSVPMVTLTLDIAPMHHRNVIGSGGGNVHKIMQETDTMIQFPDPQSQHYHHYHGNQVVVMGTVSGVLKARDMLLGCLPVVLMFDIHDSKEETISSSLMGELSRELDVFISVKPKARQPLQSVIIKSIEQNMDCVYQARLRLLEQTNMASSKATARNINLATSQTGSHKAISTQSTRDSDVNLASSTNAKSLISSSSTYNYAASSYDNSYPNKGVVVGGASAASVGVGVVSPPPIENKPVVVSTIKLEPNAQPFTPKKPSLTKPPQDQNESQGPPKPVQPVTTSSNSSPNTSGQSSQTSKTSYKSAVASTAVKLASTKTGNTSFESTKPTTVTVSSSLTSLTALKTSFTGSVKQVGPAGRVSPQYPPIKEESSATPTTSVEATPPVTLSGTPSCDAGDVTEQDNAKEEEEGRGASNTMPATPATGHETSPAPPLKRPTMRSIVDYNRRKEEAQKAMKTKVEASELRHPTKRWSGEFFSQSVPAGPDILLADEPPLESPKGLSSINRTGFQALIRQASLERMQTQQSEQDIYQGVQDLPTLLKRLSLEKYQECFDKEEVDFTTFLTMTESDFREIGVSTLGPRRKLQLAISEIRRLQNTGSSSSHQAPSQKAHSTFHHPHRYPSSLSTSPSPSPSAPPTSSSRTLPLGYRHSLPRLQQPAWGGGVGSTGDHGSRHHPPYQRSNSLRRPPVGMGGVMAGATPTQMGGGFSRSSTFSQSVRF